jgi:hypothetical protein
MKPNCYNCKYRGTLAGSAHSRCEHPATKEGAESPLTELMAIFAGVGRVAPVIVDCGLNIKANPHGIRNGWFNWPYNFDPTWLENCDGFTEKE